MPLRSWISAFIHRFRQSADDRHGSVLPGQRGQNTRVLEQTANFPERGEIEPPWIEYPGYGPGDTFWRQTGEAYFLDLWQPFYHALSEAEQQLYLGRWSVPDEWRDFYFDKAWRDWLESTDEPPDAG